MAGSRKKAADHLELYPKRDGTVGIRDLPKFRTEQEEAEWWDRNAARIMDFAVKHGFARQAASAGCGLSDLAAAAERDLDRAGNTLWPMAPWHRQIPGLRRGSGSLCR